MLWGMFKKVVVADRIAVIVNNVYGHPSDQTSLTLIIAAAGFALQIYCDFSGYSDIALGSAQAMGFKLMENFNSPYFSTSITEFWRRWHISLSAWFNDYLFLPLATRVRDWRKWGLVFALLLTFSLSGLWHGAGWKFIIYGLMHGVAISFELVTKKLRKKILNVFPPFVTTFFLRIVIFVFICVSWIFFRAESAHTALDIIHKIAQLNFHTPDMSRSLGITPAKMFLTVAVIMLLCSICLLLFSKKKNISFYQPTKMVKWALYYILILSIVFIGVHNHAEFIYFPF